MLQAATVLALSALLTHDKPQVKLLGLTRQFQIQSMLIEKGYLHGYFMEIFEIPRISLTDFNAEDSPLHQMALMLQVPDNDFTEEAVAWNTAVQNALLCLSKDIPQAMQLASDDGASFAFA